MDVALDEVRAVAGASGQPSRRLERRRGEVEPGHSRAQPRQRHGVGADVALQVGATQPGEVTQPGQVEPYDVADERGVRGEPFHRVVHLAKCRWERDYDAKLRRSAR